MDLQAEDFNKTDLKQRINPVVTFGDTCTVEPDIDKHNSSSDFCCIANKCHLCFQHLAFENPNRGLSQVKNWSKSTFFRSEEIDGQWRTFRDIDHLSQIALLLSVGPQFVER